MKCSSLRYLWSTRESLTANLLFLLGEQGICLTKSVFNNGICWGIEEGGSKVNIHSCAVHITAHVGNHKTFPFPGLFARLSPFRTTTCLQMAWNSSGEYAARRRLSQKTLPYLLVCRPQPLRSEAPKTKVMFTLYWIAFSCQHEKLFGIAWTASAQNWNKLVVRSLFPSRPVTSPVKLVGKIRPGYRARFRASSCNSDSANWPGYEAESQHGTNRTSCRSGLTRGFGELNPSPHSRKFTSVLADSAPFPSLFTSATVRIYLWHTTSKCSTERTRNMKLWFTFEIGSSASLRYGMIFVPAQKQSGIVLTRPLMRTYYKKFL